MKILFAASEMTPYAKTGGLGDVVGALPGALSQLGHEVTCCLPFYRCVREILRGANLHPPARTKPLRRGEGPAPPREGSGAPGGRALPTASGAPGQPKRSGDAASLFCGNRALPTAGMPVEEGSGAPGGRALPTTGMLLPQMTLKIALGKRVVTGEVLELMQPDGVRVLFVRCDEFYDRPELYQAGDRDYNDNAERFVFFSKAVVELIGDARFRPDVVHCHEWQTALVPAFAKAAAGKPVLLRQPSAAVAAGLRLRGKDAPVSRVCETRSSDAPVSRVCETRSSGAPVKGAATERNGAATEGSGLIGAPKTVFTIHNMAYQGVFSRAAFSLTNLPGEFFTPSTLEFYGRMNLMKGGIVFADAITTVSRKYAEEIQTPAGGCGLEGVLKTRAGHLQGIVNGVDYARWNPATDPYLRAHYSMEDLSGKQACREDLLARLGLEGGERRARTAEAERRRRISVLRQSRPTNDEAGGERRLVHPESFRGRESAYNTPPLHYSMPPLAGFVSRLVEQKGVEVLAGAIDDLVQAGVLLAILGKGERRYEAMLAAAAERYPRQVAVKIAQDEALAHQIQAGADLLLVPSRFEPCGLTQLYALKYGTIPVVRATGGLEDTVVQYNARTGEGTGFKFALYESAALVEAVRPAILLHKQPKKWQQLMRHAMACDFSWQASAKEYEQLYAAL